MPTYSFQCDICRHEFDRILTMSARNQPMEENCPSCGELSVKKIITSAAINNQSGGVEVKSASVSGEFREMMSGVKKYYNRGSR